MLVYSRDSFDRCGERNHKGGGSPLAEITRHKPILKNRTPPDVEAAVVAIAIEQPAWGQVRVAEAVKRPGPTLFPPRGRSRGPPPHPPNLEKRVQEPQGQRPHARLRSAGNPLPPL